METDKKETLAALTNVRSRFNFRQFFMVSVVLFATAADVLIDYVTAGFDPAIFSQASYWITLAITCLSVVFVVLSVRDFFREKELRENSDIFGTQKKIDGAHTELINHDLATRFEDYVNEINAARKLKAYTEYLQFKLSKITKEQKRAKWQKLLDNAATDISFLPVKGNFIRLSPFKRIHFSRVRIATIFSRMEHVYGDDDDMEAHEQRHVSGLLFKKVAMLMAFSMAFSTLFFQPGAFSVAILVNTFTKLFRTAMSVMLGATDGQDFARGTLLSKMKLRLDFIQKFLEAEKSKRATVEEQPQESRLPAVISPRPMGFGDR